MSVPRHIQHHSTRDSWNNLPTAPAVIASRCFGDCCGGNSPGKMWETLLHVEGTNSCVSKLCRETEIYSGFHGNLAIDAQRDGQMFKHTLWENQSFTPKSWWNDCGIYSLPFRSIQYTLGTAITEAGRLLGIALLDVMAEEYQMDIEYLCCTSPSIVQAGPYPGEVETFLGIICAWCQMRTHNQDPESLGYVR